MRVATGFGYFKNAAGQVTGKYEYPIGEHPDPPKGLTPVEVADAQSLAAIPIYFAPLTPVQSFNADVFAQDLLDAFGVDSNALVYYAAIKDLAVSKDFTRMNALVKALLAAGKLTQAEVTSLNAILAAQNIVLSTFTTPP